MYLKRFFVVMVASVVLLGLTGCVDSSDSVEQEFGKPALHWYQKIAISIVRGDLDSADSYYISLRSEHMRSSLMPTAVMMLAHAHMRKEEYRLANFYLDEYSKRYGDFKSREYIEYMKLKSAFLGIKDVYKDQKLIMDSIERAKSYLVRYTGSSYAPLVNTILIRLHMSIYLLNENIASLYDRTGKSDAGAIYRAKNSGSVVEMRDITPPKKGIVGEIFD
jgi:outer membrane protein assembly factor BamD